MSENIELLTFRTSSPREDDIEEYQEINVDDFGEPPFTVSHPEKMLKEYDFFTQNDVKIGKKDTLKKKKSRKKCKASNLMDVISSELAAVAIPIKENVIEVVDYTVEQRSSSLFTKMRSQNSQEMLRRLSHFDSEQGFDQKFGPVDLCPTFPSVLQAVTPENTTIQVQYIAPVKFNEVSAEFNFDTNEVTKFLNIEIKNIKFKHHHHFSLEKLLCVKLIELYAEYNELHITLNDIVNDIKINRETRDSLKHELKGIRPGKTEDVRFDDTVRQYTRNLFELKEKYLKTIQSQKEIVHKMSSLWSDIEMIREKTGQICSSEVLTVSKNELPEEEFEDEWNQTFNTEYSDILDKLEFEYVNKYIEYKEVKYTQNLDDSTKRRISKPKLHIDEEALQEEAEKITNNILSRDKIEVNLTHDASILSQQRDSSKTISKNQYFFEIYVDDVFVCESDHFTSENDVIPDVEFTDALAVEILPKNTTLSIVLSENNRQASSIHLNLVDIRRKNEASDFVKQIFAYNDIIEPNMEHVGSGHNIKEIASKNKIRLKSSNMFKGSLYTACEVSIKMGWDENMNQSGEYIKTSMAVGRQIKRLINGLDNPSTDALVEIIGKLYNRDVSNDETVLNTLRNICKCDVYVDDTFPVDENSPEFTRLKLLHLRNNGGMANVENKLIPLHASQISTELLNCLQKNQSSELNAEYFQDKYADMDPIEIQRFIGAKYLQKLNKNMLKNINEHLLRKTHKDVVRDFKDLSWRTLFTNQSNLTLANISSSTKQQLLSAALNREQEIRITVTRAFNLPDRSALVDDNEDEQIAGFKMRGLRPMVVVSYAGTSSRTAPAAGCHPSWAHTLKLNTRLLPLSSIHVNVFDEHRTHVPDSSDGEENRSIHYRYCNRWLGGLQIPIQAVLSLGSLRGTFKLTTPPALFGYETTTKSTQSTLSLIPAVTQLLKKEASFISLHITTSLSHLGGLHSYNQPVPDSDDDYIINRLNTFVTEYLNDFPSRNISLTFIDSSGKNKCVTQFLQPIPLPDFECFPKNPKHRLESAVSKSSGQSKSSSSSGRRRSEIERVRSESERERTDSDSRYRTESERASYQSGEERESLYSALSWKSGDNQLEKIIAGISKYVALIPTYEVNESYTVTLSGFELLKVVHGSPLDHSLLLASYFLHLGLRCWVAIGLGLPRGHSSYVLTKHDMGLRRLVLQNDQMKSRSFLNRNESCIWYVNDAVSGERTELRDVGCPLKTVDFVFDNENIWVNMQSSLDCESLSFDFSRSSEWQPVFDKSVFVMKQPVLNDPGLYVLPPEVDRLKQVLENKIKEKVQKWRSNMKTIWNRYCSSLLRETLPYWEYWAFNQAEHKPGMNQRLKQLMVSYKMFGCPLNMPYVNTKSVISTVKATGIHNNADPSVEFGLAVELYPYPNNVVSVWVFFACVTRI